ncbi:hypothetical protein ACIBG8_46790 [Nonomuraea sp. NPDC050556]|uniref:hypothetical protein n=1 Tax=Nonomuraea sp. NPDC050556 TaxID=3364369 RepID=UPI0037991F4D
MMPRQQVADLREHAQAAHLISDADELATIVTTLLSELDGARQREQIVRGEYGALLTAARATIAADQSSEAEPLTHLRWELARHGQLPTGQTSPMRVLADAATTQTLVEHLTEHTPPAIGWPCTGCGTAMLTPGIDIAIPADGRCPSCSTAGASRTSALGVSA